MSHAWMPLNVDDYLSDTQHLSAAEHGAYMLLIMRYWKDGGLPDDERMIARYARLSSEQWAESRDVLAAFFDDGWKHRRIDAELAKANEIVSKRKSAALHRHSKSDAHAVQVQSTSTYAGVPPKPEPSASLRSADTGAKRAARLPADWSLPDGWGKDAIDAGLPADLIDLEASKMRDWSLSSPNGACKDWRARWRNWCREAAQRRPRAGPEKPVRLADRARQLGQQIEEARNVRSSEGGGSLLQALPDLSVISGGGR